MKEILNETSETNWNNGTDTSLVTESLTVYKMLSLGILVLETIIGTFMNGLMVIVNLNSLVTHRKLGSCDLILTCLGLSRFTFMWLVLLTYFLSYLAPSYTNIGTNIQFAWLFFNYLSLWFATWLSTFYCVRLVNIQRKIFTAFKKHFDHLVPLLILASIAISASCSNSKAYNGINQTFNINKSENKKKSSAFAVLGTDFTTFTTLSVVGSIPPFFLFCVSAGLVVDSLLRHTKKMKQQEKTGFREPSFDAHYRAVKMMAAFFIFFSLYMMAFNLYGTDIADSAILNCIAALLIGAYPSVHSVLLVIGNHKLKHTLLQILQKANCYRTELIETIST
ncbi:taste receptor type 2 member 2-like [Rhinoderma darwinii]|uniref:taste receptor type 2 member 2-like n=1 Tax=Rhinoderma darwinii TaxID=43563 RepID=UPI003F66D64D